MKKQNINVRTKHEAIELGDSLISSMDSKAIDFYIKLEVEQYKKQQSKLKKKRGVKSC